MTAESYIKGQSKREARCARSIKGKSLLVIDHILSNVGSEDPLLGLIYQIAHSATGVCGNTHDDWVEQTHRLYKEVTNVI